MAGVEFARHWPHPASAGTDLLSARYVTHAFGRHWHRQYAVGVITGGMEDFQYRGALHHAGSGSVVMVDAESVHTGQPGVDGGWRYQMLYVDVGLVRSVAGGVTPTFGQVLVDDRQAASALLRAHAAAAHTDRLAASQTLREAMTVLVRRYACPGPIAEVADVGAPLVRRSAELLRARLVDPPSLNELAELVGCGSPYALIRAFGRHLGIPPHAYLTQCRVDRARALLAAGGDVAATAHAVGFADQAHLTRQFRRHVGVPPARYARERRIVQETRARRL